ncbi:MAG: methyltransferase domain-containing protein [Candidatus Lokiarchaeota archaeon]|nr:methyltransferase domain-containing protein [Candidatus Lokiarchaeota archaeon]
MRFGKRFFRKRILKPLKNIKDDCRREINNWSVSYQARKEYSSGRDRRPFYQLAKKYLPIEPQEVIVDIGAGQGYFAEYLHLNKTFPNFYLLDASHSSIEHLKNKFKNIKLYVAPDKLPFDDDSVGFIHCSHLVEHLYHAELYKFLQEIDRVLKAGGILVISTPLFWTNFYGELSHVRPYNPEVFLGCFCRKLDQSSLESIAGNYRILEQIYRYTNISFEEWGSENKFFDGVVYLFKGILQTLGIKKYIKNGYTLVLQKI